MNPYDDNWYDGREVARLEAALQRSTNDFGNLCTELHALKRERTALQSKLETLLEAAEAAHVHLESHDPDYDRDDRQVYDDKAWDVAERLSAAVKKAREGL